MLAKGCLEKMIGTLGQTVTYELPVGGTTLPLQPLLGKPIRIFYSGLIHCKACGRKANKSYSQGHCYPCSQRLASCDLCIMKPETCHYDLGTCREPGWGQSHCMQPHYVYLANTSGLKVGITRHTQIPTRWIDQGATEALPIFKVATRYQSGLIEEACKAHVADRTDWRKMLKGAGKSLELYTLRDELLQKCNDHFNALKVRFGERNLQALPDAEVTHLHYPVEVYPQKVTSLSLDKTPLIEGTLLGVKGQYLIFDIGVLNIRKFTGYEVEVQG